jgi:hypothetical protein
VAATLASPGNLGPAQAYVLHELSGRPGKDGQVYGVHKQGGWGSVERRCGIAVLGPDTLLPITGHALVTETRDDRKHADPCRLERAQEAMCQWRLDPPSSVAEHAAQHLGLVNDAREMVRRAAEHGSTALTTVGLDPRRMLVAGFPRWLLCGRIQYGPRTSKSIATAGRILEPGLDSALIRAALHAGYRPVFRAGDSVSDPGTQISSLALLDATTLAGPELFAALYRGDTKSVPGLRWLIEPEVDVVADQIRRRCLPIDVEHIRIALVPHGLAIMGGKLMRVVGIVIATPVKSTLMVSPGDIRGDRWIDLVVMALLAEQVTTNSTWASCTARFQRDCAIFHEQASSYHGRNGVRLLKMISNIVVASVARADG